MKFSSKLFPALVSMIVSSGCVPQYPAPVSPPYPFEINGYSIFVDQEPGRYDVIPIGDRTYCYFSKKMDDEDILFMEDKNCDLHSDRVVVLSDTKIIIMYDTKALPIRTGQYLDSILQNHTKYILKNDTVNF